MSNPVRDLTESEVRSLVAAITPHLLKTESLQFALRAADCDHNRDRSSTKTFLHRHLRFVDNEPSARLEGLAISRHWLNPKALVAVGEFQSFAHLPGVGTQWQVGNQRGTDIQHRFLYSQLYHIVCEILLPTHARKVFRRRWREFVLPYPPPPIAIQRRQAERLGKVISPKLLPLLSAIGVSCSHEV